VCGREATNGLQDYGELGMAYAGRSRSWRISHGTPNGIITIAEANHRIELEDMTSRRGFVLRASST